MSFLNKIITFQKLQPQFKQQQVQKKGIYKDKSRLIQNLQKKDVVKLENTKQNGYQLSYGTIQNEPRYQQQSQLQEQDEVQLLNQFIYTQHQLEISYNREFQTLTNNIPDQDHQNLDGIIKYDHTTNRQGNKMFNNNTYDIIKPSNLQNYCKQQQEEEENIPSKNDQYQERAIEFEKITQSNEFKMIYPKKIKLIFKLKVLNYQSYNLPQFVAAKRCKGGDKQFLKENNILQLCKGKYCQEYYGSTTMIQDTIPYKYFLIENLQYGSLNDYLWNINHQKVCKINKPLFLIIVLKLTKMLYFCHRILNILHMDFKPGNAMFNFFIKQYQTMNFNFKLIDFEHAMIKQKDTFQLNELIYLDAGDNFTFFHGTTGYQDNKILQQYQIEAEWPDIYALIQTIKEITNYSNDECIPISQFLISTLQASRSRIDLATIESYIQEQQLINCQQISNSQTYKYLFDQITQQCTIPKL